MYVVCCWLLSSKLVGCRGFSLRVVPFFASSAPPMSVRSVVSVPSSPRPPSSPPSPPSGTTELGSPSCLRSRSRSRSRPRTLSQQSPVARDPRSPPPFTPTIPDSPVAPPLLPSPCPDVPNAPGPSAPPLLLPDPPSSPSPWWAPSFAVAPPRPPVSPVLIPDPAPPVLVPDGLDGLLMGEHDIVVPPPSPSPVPESFVINFIPYAPGVTWTPEPSIFGRIGRRRGIVRRFGGGRIFWPNDLPVLGTSISDCTWFAYCESRRIIKASPRDQYYIGATFCPYDRYWGPHDDRHEHRNTYRSMHVIGLSTGFGIKRLERELIGNPEVGRDRTLCRNIAPGGEGISTECPFTPYLLYIVIGVDNLPTNDEADRVYCGRYVE